jgi:hypothetical protein
MDWSFLDELRLSVLAAPMFLVSNPDLVMMQCKAGIIGSFPAVNAMWQDLLDSWSTEIEMRLISEVDTRAGHETGQLAVKLCGPSHECPSGCRSRFNRGTSRRAVSDSSAYNTHGLRYSYNVAKILAHSRSPELARCRHVLGWQPR